MYQTYVTPPGPHHHTEQVSNLEFQAREAGALTRNAKDYTDARAQGRAETFGGAGAQNIKGHMKKRL